MPSFKVLVVLSLGLLTSALSFAFEHHWSDASKEAVGTAYGKRSSKVWFTVKRGILTEAYFPRIDRAQVGDSQLLFMLGKTFLEEKRDFVHEIGHPPAVPRVSIRSSAGAGDRQIVFVKDIITDPLRPVIRIRYRFKELPADTTIYLLHKPAADNDADHDLALTYTKRPGATAFVTWDGESSDRSYQAVLTSVPVKKASVGVVGETDAWQDLKKNGKLTHEFQRNGPGNLALAAELEAAKELEVLIGFGSSADEALDAAVASLGEDFAATRQVYDEAWSSYVRKLGETPWLDELPLKIHDDLLWDAVVIKTHEDKLNPGAIIASLSIPDLPAGRGAADGKATGGYHLVWSRDLFKSALGLLRLGDANTAVNALRFMSRMEHDGKMAQNAWVDGRPFWTGEQMDEEAFPILLAHELEKAGVSLDDELRAFVGRRVERVRASTGFTGQERWEEAAGFSPNTLAVMAASMSRIGDEKSAKRFLSAALEKTASKQGPLSKKPYFVRISETGRPDEGHLIKIANGGPLLPEYRVLDGGFLEWLRWFPSPEKYFGKAGTELSSVIDNTLALYDDPEHGVAVPARGPLFRRYSSDAYGVGRAGGPWPILSLERALPDMEKNPYAAFRFIEYVRGLYGPGDMCPEQLAPNREPMPYAASPLVWCHAEMIELANRAVSLKN